MTAQTIPIRTTLIPAEKRRPDGFRRLTTAAVLLLTVPFSLFGAFVLHQFDPFVSGLIVVSLLCGLLSALRFRLAPIAGSLWGGLLALLVAGMSSDALMRPGGGGMEFAVAASFTFLGGVAAVCGVVATVRGYRGAAGPLPGWFQAGLIAAAGVFTGAILVQSIPAKNVSAGVSDNVLAALPPITARDFSFAQQEVRVKAGETAVFRLENADAVGHTFEIDELGVHVALASGTSGLALFRPSAPGTYTFYCLPHYDKASGEGMHGTLIVE